MSGFDLWILCFLIVGLNILLKLCGFYDADLTNKEDSK